MMSTKWIVAVGAIAFVTGCTSDKSPSSAAPTLNANAESGGPDSAACQKFIQSLPNDVMRGFVTQAVDPRNPSGPSIQIFYYGHLIDGVAPIAVFNGGPTGNSWSTYQVMTKRQKNDPEIQGVPLVFIDQRGTGCSSPYPHVKYWSDINGLQNWGSAGIVADSEAVRKKLLGDKPWKILGQSYGGLIVHRYAQMAPTSLISASAHGFALTSDPLVTLQARIESQKKSLDAYLAKYPEDQQTLTTINAQLASNPCFTNSSGKIKICGHRVLQPLYEELGFLDEWQYLHSHLQRIQSSGGVINQDWIDRVATAPAYYRNADASMADSVIWHTDMNFASTNYASCFAIYQNLNAKGEHPESWLMNECQPAMDLKTAPALSKTTQYIDELPQQIITLESFKATLVANPGLKFYLYSGELDPYSPVAIFQEEIAMMASLIHYTDFATTGHDGFFTEDQVWKNLMLN